MAAPTTSLRREEFYLPNSEPSTHGPIASFRCHIVSRVLVANGNSFSVGDIAAKRIKASILTLPKRTSAGLQPFASAALPHMSIVVKTMMVFVIVIINDRVPINGK